jgi:fructose-1,6-bisphosphatase/inositol monophosphatase family enzyme
MTPSPGARFPGPQEDDLLETCKAAMLQAQKVISKSVFEDPERAFRPVRVPGKARDHVTTWIDLEAQRQAERVLLRSGIPVRVLGEETPMTAAVDLRRESRPVVLLDMIDGTDLLTREMGNWCSAMVVFHPPTAEILGALVGLPLGDLFKLYVASRSYEGAYLLTYEILPAKSGLRYMLLEDPHRSIAPLHPRSHRPVGDRPLDGASICFYGQKRSRLLHLRDETDFPWDSSLEKSGRLRIYTLAGNPMLAKLAEGRVSAVFEAKGQRPHDCIPGLYLAEKAGAAVSGLDGKPLDLGRALLERRDVSYIAAGDRLLLRELGRLIA